MSDVHCFILANLLRLNTNLHGKALKKQGNPQLWTETMKATIAKELSRHPKNLKLNAYSTWIWGRFMGHGLYTREIYILLLQWGVRLTELKMLYMLTDDYVNLLDELRLRIEEGADGKHKEISAAETLKEWDAMQEYLPELHKMADDFENNLK